MIAHLEDEFGQPIDAAGSDWGFIIFLGLLAAVVFGLIGARIGAERGRATQGFWLGFCFGPIGWIVIGVLSPSREVQAERDSALADRLAEALRKPPPRVSQRTGERSCPFCIELIRDAAVVCRHCGRDVAPVTT